jgi:hypothetical protein
MSAPNPNDPRPGTNDVPEGFERIEGIRYLVHGNTVTIIDERPGNTNPGPLPPHMLEQIRRGLRPCLREEPPPEEPPAAG